MDTRKMIGGVLILTLGLLLGGCTAETTTTQTTTTKKNASYVYGAPQTGSNMR